MNNSEGSDINPSEEELEMDDSNEEYDEMIMIPNADSSGDKDERSENEDQICSSLDWLSKVSYENAKAIQKIKKCWKLIISITGLMGKQFILIRLKIMFYYLITKKKRLLKIHKFNSSKHFFLMK